MAAGSSEVPRALLWDVDGTLAETEQHGHLPAYNLAFAELGLPWRWDEASYRDWLSVSGGRERLAAFLEAMEGRPPSVSLVEDLFAAKQRHYAAILRKGHLPLRPGVAALIAETAAAGIPQAVVTTSSRQAVAALIEGQPESLAAAFRFWICGEDVLAKKPHPEAYRQAVEQLGDEAPEALLAIEDSPNGLAAATAAGLPCLVTPGAQSAAVPEGAFAAARAVVEALAEEDGAVRVRRGPACPGGRVTLAYLGRLLERR
jgi:HAD superfamily hydrolase (TIGR01509 family)